MKPAILAGATLAIALSALSGAMAQSYEGSVSRSRDGTGGRVEGLLGRSRSDLLGGPDDLADDEAPRERPRNRPRVVNPAPPGLCTLSTPLRRLSPQAAVRLGWCLMDADRPMQAAPAFAHAVEFGDDRTRQEAAYGRTLALLRKTVTDQAGVSATDAPQSRQRNAELGANLLEQRALAAFRDGRFVETILHLDNRERLGPMQSDLLVLKGYAYLKVGQSEDANRIFRALERAGVPEGAAGLNAVNLALGLMRSE
jgi:hypothetical protein